MKKLFVLTTILAGALVTSSAYSQLYVNAHIGFGVPAHRIYAAPAPSPVYQDECAPAPATVVYENEFPGYAYYNYPSWNGHYRDRFYYEHYRPYFERDHRTYFHNRRFDNARFEHDRGGRGGYRGGRHW